MEQSKVCTTTSRKFSDELSAVYEHISAYRNAVNVDDEQLDKSKSRSFASIATTIFLIFVALYSVLRYLLPSTSEGNKEGVRLFMQMMVLFVYVLDGVILRLQYKSIKSIYTHLTLALIIYDSQKNNQIRVA